MRVLEKGNEDQADGRRLWVDIVQRIDVTDLTTMDTFQSNLNATFLIAQEARRGRPYLL